jgi:hypothetical protein
MTQAEGERTIKKLQKEFLVWAEEHPTLRNLPADDFDGLRRSVFRGTFQAFRLGIIGLDDASNLRQHFFQWFDGVSPHLEFYAQTNLAMECFRISLEAFRVGALVAGARSNEPQVYSR